MDDIDSLDNFELLENLGVLLEKREVISGYLKRFYKKDPLLYFHCIGVGILMKESVDYLIKDSDKRGIECYFDREPCISSALIHDEGKLGVSDDVLHRADYGGFDPLGNDGRRMFMPHVEKGMRDLRGGLPIEAEIVSLHHFPWYYFPESGLKFPDSFSLEKIRDIYYCSRLLHIVDDYQAATTRNNGRNGEKPLGNGDVRGYLIDKKRKEESMILEMNVDCVSIRDIMVDEINDNCDLIERLYEGRVF